MSLTIDTVGLVEDMAEAEYHARPELSSTGARDLLRSPAHYQWRRAHPRQSTAFDVGRAVHAIVLGIGAAVDVLDFDSYRSNAAKEARDEAVAAGLTPILRDDYQPIIDMAQAVTGHAGAVELLEGDGIAEASAFAADPETGVGLRARCDWLPDLSDDGPTIIVDLKTALNADPREFYRAAATYGYDIQAEWYQEVVRLARGDSATEFRFVVVEKEAPYLVSVIELDAEFAAIGRSRMRRAIDHYKSCTDAGQWPGYPEITHLVGPPRWLAFEEGMEDMSWT